MPDYGSSSISAGTIPGSKDFASAADAMGQHPLIYGTLAMKRTLFASALCLLAPIAAHAACAPTDFAIKDFQVNVSAGGIRTKMIMKGELVNHCAEAAAAQIEISAKDGSGNVVATKKAWPAGTTNIGPGQSISFDLGRRFRYQPEMQTYAAGIVSVRSW
ncbi:MAG: hypothetical protein OQK79_06120 [Rhodanobacter sp.]|nr:hypothetical protein [Rhodanobacter sp.]